MSTKRRILVAAVTSVVLCISATAHAQAVDTFAPNANDYIFATAIQADGRILIGGNFSSAGCNPGCAGPARL